MVLGDLEQILLGQPRRLRKDGAGNLDRLVARQRAHHGDGGVLHRGEAIGEFDACLGLDLLGQAGNHVVEDADMLFGIAVGAAHEQVGDAPQCLDALIRRTG